ncbi:hypothetical protein RT717_19385 [Imperialibacter roseus]|uniref:HTH cro/C1-type domain-containing protein n=1 Tax=Imperialibacter roseus TaxID=1324217 RepID=A0ABZ0IL49_9BACT|nr:hypothetical protein [Imperialibacter roseus]WOK05246.1 hypothetical protein RT717_19385 [Imperialibacter roseus]
MKTKEKYVGSTIQKLRDIREKVGRDIEDMTFEQLSEYLKNKKPLHPAMAKKLGEKGT